HAVSEGTKADERLDPAMLLLLGAGATPPATPSLDQLGLNTVTTQGSQAALSYSTSYVNAQVDPSGQVSADGAQLQTQYGEAVADGIASAIVPGGGIITQAIFSAFGTAQGGSGCTCPNCPEPFESPPTLAQGPTGSFQQMCNVTGINEWLQDAPFSGYRDTRW